MANDNEHDDDAPEASEKTEAAPSEAAAAPSPGDELKAAFGHLRSAAGIFLERIKGDEALKKAAEGAENAVTRAATGAERALGTMATETERALKKLGERAEPMAKTVAKEIGDEFDRVAKSVSSVFEADPIPREGDAGDESGTPGESAAAEARPTREKDADPTDDDGEGTPRP